MKASNQDSPNAMIMQPRFKAQASLPISLKPIKINSSPFQQASEAEKNHEHKIDPSSTLQQRPAVTARVPDIMSRTVSKQDYDNSQDKSAI